MSLKLLLAVGAGGALGAMARYLVSTMVGVWAGDGFPWGTFTVNVVGSLLLGALVEFMISDGATNEATRAFLVVGVLGAFTTFSTFSLDIHGLLARDQWLSATLYVAGSVITGFGALLAGMAMTRHAFA